MKVAGGIYRSRSLLSPSGREVRPTAGVVKEALMNMLGTGLHGARVLELFCGTGQLGIEAVSRGAASCVFVDSSRASCDITRRNLDALGIRAEVITSDWAAALNRFAPGSFDIVIADPPYSSGVYEKLQQELLSRGLPASGGILVLEHDRTLAPGISDGFTVYKQRAHGRRCLLLLKPGQPEQTAKE